MASEIPQDLMQKLSTLDRAATSALPGGLSGGGLQLPQSIPVMEQLQALQDGLQNVQDRQSVGKTPAKLPQQIPGPGGQPGQTASLSLPGAMAMKDLAATDASNGQPRVPGGLAALPAPQQRQLALPGPDQLGRASAPTLPATITMPTRPHTGSTPATALPRATAFSGLASANVIANQLPAMAAQNLATVQGNSQRHGFPEGGGKTLPRSIPGQLPQGEIVRPPAVGPLAPEPVPVGLPKALPTPTSPLSAGNSAAAVALPALPLPNFPPAGEFPGMPPALPRALSAGSGPGLPARMSAPSWPAMPESGRTPPGSLPALPRSISGAVQALAANSEQTPTLPRALPGSASPIADSLDADHAGSVGGLPDLVGNLAKMIGSIKELIGKMGEQKSKSTERSSHDNPYFLPPISARPRSPHSPWGGED